MSYSFISQKSLFHRSTIKCWSLSKVNWKPVNFLLHCWLLLAFVAMLVSPCSWFLLRVNLSLLQYLVFSLGGSSLKSSSSLPSVSWAAFRISSWHPLIISWQNIWMFTAHPHSRSSGAIKFQDNTQVLIQPSCTSAWELNDPAPWIAYPLFGSAVAFVGHCIRGPLINLWQSRTL